MRLSEGLGGEQSVGPSQGATRWVEIRWRERIGRGTLAAAGAQLFVLDERTGELRIVQAVPDGYRLLSQARVFTPDVTSVTGPSIAHGRLFVRNTKELAAFQLGS